LVYISRNSQPQQLGAINFLAAAASVVFLRFRYILATRNNLLSRQLRFSHAHLVDRCIFLISIIKYSFQSTIDWIMQRDAIITDANLHFCYRRKENDFLPCFDIIRERKFIVDDIFKVNN